MTASSKLVLLLAALLIGVSMLYVGVILPGDGSGEMPAPESGTSEAEALTASAAGLDRSDRPTLGASAESRRRDTGESAAGRPRLGGSAPPIPRTRLGGAGAGDPSTATERDAARPGLSERPGLSSRSSLGRGNASANARPGLSAGADRSDAASASSSRPPLTPAARPALTGPRDADAADPGEQERTGTGASRSPLARPTPGLQPPADRSEEAATPARPDSASESKPAATTRETPTRRRTPATTPSPAPGDQGGAWTVEAGDTLTSISKSWFGSAAHWRLILDANPGLRPEAMRVGRRLVLPPRSAAGKGSVPADRTATPSPPDRSRPVLAPGEREHTVEKGDTLSSIAARYLGTANRWRLVADANERLLGGDANRLKIGMVLRIPATPKD